MHQKNIEWYIAGSNTVSLQQSTCSYGTAQMQLDTHEQQIRAVWDFYPRFFQFWPTSFHIHHIQ